MVAGGFWLHVATEGPGGGMCQIWSGKIWCKENLAPAFPIELNYLAQNIRHNWLLTSGYYFLWTFH